VTNGAVLDLHGRRHDPDGAVYEQDVVYGQGSGRDLTLDLYRRSEPSEQAPAVVFVHGGGWGGGDRWFHMRHCHSLAAAGYVTATIGYRLSGEAAWPASIEDAKCAVRWLRAHAEQLGADPERIAVAGGSAGGHLAALVTLTPGQQEGDGGWAETSSVVQAAVLWYPAVDLVATPWPAEMADYLVGYFGDHQADASPVNHVHGAAPPILTITGSADTLTTLDLIRRFHDALSDAGVDNRLEVFDGRDHAFDLFPADWQQSYDLLKSFLDATL